MSEPLDLLAGLVIEDGRRWGEAAVEWQVEDAEAILDTSGPPLHFLTRARGGSKTSDLAGIALAAMLAQLPGGSRLYALAGDRDQGRLVLDAIEGYVQRTPDLRGEVEIAQWRVTAPRLGSTLDVLAADAATSWGIRPNFVVVDEVCQWGNGSAPRRLFESVTSSVAKVPGSRLAIISTAGDPGHWSRKVLDHALSDPLWRVHEVEGPAPWLDPDRLAEQRRRLPESLYARLFENRWVASEDRLADPDAIRSLVVLDGPLPPDPRNVYVVSVDLGLKHDRTVATVCHAEPILRSPDGGFEQIVSGHRLVLDRIEVWQGTRQRPVELAEVEAWVAMAAAAYRARVVIDPWQSAAMAQRLRHRGLRVEEFAFSAQSVGRIARTLLVLIRNRALCLPDDEALLDELANVRVREPTPGVYRIDHDPDRHDDRVVALGLAAVSLLDNAPSLPGRDPIFGGALDAWIFAGLPHGDELAREGRYIAAAYGAPW